MSDIYKMLTSLTPNVENNNNEKTNVSKTSVVDWEIQKVLNVYIYHFLFLINKFVFFC